MIKRLAGCIREYKKDAILTPILVAVECAFESRRKQLLHRLPCKNRRRAQRWHYKKSVEFWTNFMQSKPDGYMLCIENVLEEDPDQMAELIDGITVTANWMQDRTTPFALTTKWSMTRI